MIIQLAFEIIEATCHQQLKLLNDKYDEESIIRGLNQGILVTTTWHDKDVKTIDIVATGEPVAEILSQEIDGEYNQFR